jgi:hypothetical protein
MLIIMLSFVHIDWGSVIESEMNLALETKYEVDFDKDGKKESDSSEDEPSIINTLLYFSHATIQLADIIPHKYKLIIPTSSCGSYSFYLISRIERPPNSKLI